MTLTLFSAACMKCLICAPRWIWLERLIAFTHFQLCCVMPRAALVHVWHCSLSFPACLYCGAHAKVNTVLLPELWEIKLPVVIPTVGLEVECIGGHLDHMLP